MRLPAAVASCALSLLIAPTVRADVVATVAEHPDKVAQTRVVLIGLPEPVFAATSEALGPWSIAVETDNDAAPASNADAAAIAHAHGATAVAWMDRGELVIYDDLRGVSERHAVPAPVDDVSAAAIALSIKTSLRHPGTTVSMTEVTRTTTPAPIVIQVMNPPERRFIPHVVAGLGAGMPLSSPAPTMMRFSGQISVELPRLDHLGALAKLEAGPSAGISGTMTGSYRDVAIAAGAEWRQPLTRSLWIVPAIAGTLHLTHLEGSYSQNGHDHAVAQSASPAGVELSVGVEAGRRIRGGATLYGSFLAGTDRYQIRGQDVVVVPAATVGIALRISFQ